MNNLCFYTGQTPLSNYMCNNCSLFLETCIPIASKDGYALGAECDAYFCEGCQQICNITNYNNIEKGEV